MAVGHNGLSSENIFLPIFIMLLTLGGSPPVVLFHPGLCGADYPATSPPGPAGAWPASGARSTATHAWPPSPFPPHSGVFLTCVWIWWALYSTVTVSIIFLPSLIAHLNVRKLFHLLRRLWRHALRREHLLGYHVLECPK